jgi:hypothetical protein
MSGVQRWEVKDSDNRWYKFDQQQKSHSCGPAAIKIVKESVSGANLSEEQMRNITAIFKSDVVPSPYDLYDDPDNRPPGQMAQVPASIHDWTQHGATAEHLINALKASPCPVPLATRIEFGVSKALLDATRNHPVLLFCRFPTGGHWIVSMGRLKSNPTCATILDPAVGLRYIDTTKQQKGHIKYGKNGEIMWAIRT